MYFEEYFELSFIVLRAGDLYYSEEGVFSNWFLISFIVTVCSSSESDISFLMEIWFLGVSSSSKSQLIVFVFFSNLNYCKAGFFSYFFVGIPNYSSKSSPTSCCAIWITWFIPFFFLLFFCFFSSSLLSSLSGIYTLSNLFWSSMSIRFFYFTLSGINLFMVMFIFYFYFWEVETDGPFSPNSYFIFSVFVVFFGF